jgi:hypothetical protein
VNADRALVIEDLGEVCETLGSRTVGREEIVAWELSVAGL